MSFFSFFAAVTIAYGSILKCKRMKPPVTLVALLLKPADSRKRRTAS